MKKKQLVICGGGNSAHKLIPLLNDSIFEVSVFTSRPEQWSDMLTLEWHNSIGEIMGKYSGPLKQASNDPNVLFPQADYIVFCMPVHQYRKALHAIAPYLNRNKTIVIGTVYGQGGWNWMVDEIRKEYNFTNIVAFAFGLIPWVSRLVEYGHTGLTYGCMSMNYAAVSPREYFHTIDDEFFNQVCCRWFEKGKVEQSDNFISLTLSVDNQVIHTARCCAIHERYGRQWNSKEDVPLFYRDFDALSSQLMEGLDRDYSKIRDAIKLRYPKKNFRHMLNYLSLEYFSHEYYSDDVLDSILSSQTLHSITTPVIQNETGKWEIPKNHRFFMDDIYYGNCIAKWIAEILGIRVGTIDKILHWAQDVRGERIIDEYDSLILDSSDLTTPFKSGIPIFYGYKTIDDIID